MHKELNLDRLTLRHTKHKGSIMYLCVNNMARLTLCDKIKCVYEEHNIRTRAAENMELIVPNVRNSLCRKNFFILVPSIGMHYLKISNLLNHITASNPGS